jgi:hypothetical protein
MGKRASYNVISTVVSVRYRGVIDWPLVFERVLISLSTEEYHVRPKNAVFWDITPCGSSKNRRFGATYRLHLQGGRTDPSWQRGYTRRASCNGISTAVSIRYGGVIADWPPHRGALRRDEERCLLGYYTVWF